MKRITAAEFKDAVKLDPAWAAKLTEPVEITGYCSMPRSPITHFSPLLRFLGRNRKGYCANFKRCHALKVAEGHFAGFVDFLGTGIEKFGKLNVKLPSELGRAANFDQCEHLRVATGNYPGSVTFRCSGIESIDQPIVNQPDSEGEAEIVEGGTVGQVPGR